MRVPRTQLGRHAHGRDARLDAVIRGRDSALLASERTAVIRKHLAAHHSITPVSRFTAEARLNN